jgi:4-diphosphocytidyl-2-C-methyl-D-erythritol kinase
VNPGVHVSSAAAFGGILPREAAGSLKILIQLPVESWKDQVRNDFEETIFPLFPEIKDIKDSLYANGAIYASMSGSGSSVYGIFSNGLQESPLFPTHYIVHRFQL